MARKMTLGDIIKNYRRQNDITVEEFARQAGISRGMVYKIEANDNGNGKGEPHPQQKTVKNIAMILGITIEELEALTGKKYKSSEEKRKERLMEWEKNKANQVNIRLRLPITTYEALSRAAEDAGTSMNNMACSILERQLKM